MSDIQTLLADMRAYCEEADLPITVLCRRAVKDSKFVSRLEGGGECLPSTMAKVRCYMAENPPKDAAPDQGETSPDRAPAAKVA